MPKEHELRLLSAAQCAEATAAQQFYEVAVSTEKIILTKLSIPGGECTKKFFSAKSKKRLF